MEISDIIMDALQYPFKNITALILYVVLGIIAGIAVAGTISAIAVGAAYKNIFAVIGSGIIGIIITLVVVFAINGFELDIIKYGINRDDGAPGIDFVRQFINGVKLFAVNVVYYIIPIIIGAILAIIFQDWLSGIITAIISIVFSLAAIMAQCRLAKTEDLGYALSVGEAIGDISRVGILRLIILIILIAVIVFVALIVVVMIINWNSTVGGILLGILAVYLAFFSGRATGLLYSGV